MNKYLVGWVLSLRFRNGPPHVLKSGSCFIDAVNLNEEEARRMMRSRLNALHDEHVEVKIKVVSAIN